MRDRYDEIKAHGADVVAVGMGWPEAAAAFRDDQRIPFPLVVDQTKESYRALGLRRGGQGDVLGPKVWLRGAASILQGNRQGIPRQDALQLGGAVVVDADGEVRFVHRSSNSSDNVPVDRLIAALPR